MAEQTETCVHCGKDYLRCKHWYEPAPAPASTTPPEETIDEMRAKAGLKTPKRTRPKAKPEPSEPDEVPCIDCGRPYPHGVDMVLTRKQWTVVNPDVGGILCPSCIANRVSLLPDRICLYAHIVNGSDYDASEDVLERMILSIRLENADYCRENLELNGYLAAAEARVSELEGALTVYQMAFHDACVDAHPEDEGFQEYKLQNLRDAEVELKMLDVVVPEFMKELGMEHPVSRPAQNGEDTQK